MSIEMQLEHMPHSCALQMQAMYTTLKKAEKKAADYLINHAKGVNRLSIQEFALEAGCSEATVVRLSKKLGYEGFPELKRDFAAYENSSEIHEYGNIQDNDVPLDVMRKVFEASVQGLVDTLNMLDHDSYTRALESLIGSQRILFCGLGDAGAVAMEAHLRFLRIGVLSLHSADPDTQLILASQLQKHDTVVAISHSGRSRQILDVGKVAKDRGATVILLTNFPVSPLSKKSDIILQTAVFSKNITGEIMSKRITALCIIESLYINFMLHAKGSFAETLRVANETIAINKI
jgi:DNA-binding MurR/RpiR family transcriptional regulator